MYAHKFGFQSNGDSKEGILNAIRPIKVNTIHVNTYNTHVLNELGPTSVKNTKRQTSTKLLQ